jgi:ankyrin repeat protein
MHHVTNVPPHFFQLFKCAANPNACDELGRTLLTKACIYPDLLPTVTELLKCENIDVNLPSKDKAMHTPIHVAALSNNIQAAQALLELKDSEGKCRANINAKDGYDHTPLYMAVESDKTYDLFDLLLKHGADINIIQGGKNGFGPIHFAAQNGCVKILEALINHPTCNIELLNAEGDTALGVAAICNQAACVKFLLQKKAHASCIDKHGNTLLHNTAREGYIKSMRKLIPYLYRVINTSNNNGFAPLHTAIIKGHIPCAQLLLTAGAKVGIKTKNGDTPLHYAASNNNVQGIELLLNHGACINEKSNNEFIFSDMNLGGYTPLHYAAHRGHLQAVQKLVELGANICAKTTLEKTPLDLAYNYGHPKVGKYLAQKTSLLTIEYMQQQIKNW